MKHFPLLLTVAMCLLVSGSACAQRLPPGGPQNRAGDRNEERSLPRRDADDDEDTAPSRTVEDPVIGTADALGNGEVEESQGVVSEQERMADAEEAAPPKTKQVAAKRPTAKKAKAMAGKKGKPSKLKKGKPPGKAGRKALKPAGKKPVKKPTKKVVKKKR